MSHQEPTNLTLRPRFNTDDALEFFFPGQIISLKPSDAPETSFIVHKLSTPVTQSIVLLAKPVGEDDSDYVVIKICDPRYIGDRVPKLHSHRSYPWNVANECAAATARSENARLSYEDLLGMTYCHRNYERNPTIDNLPAHLVLWEELFYRLVTESYASEVGAYRRLEHLQGSTIPRLLMTAECLPPDSEQRVIRPPALVLQYIPCVKLYDVPFDEVDPAVCEPLLADLESMSSHGVIHNDIQLTNIHLAPPEKPVRGVPLDFGQAMLQDNVPDEAEWAAMVEFEGEVQLVRNLLQKREYRKSFEIDGARIGGFR